MDRRAQTPSESEPAPTIVENRISGTRITVWDVFYYLDTGCSAEEIATILRLSPEQVRAATQYVETHKDEVTEIHRKIEERMKRGNPPELKAKLASSHARFLEKVKRIRQGKNEDTNGAGRSGGQ